MVSLKHEDELRDTIAALSRDMDRVASSRDYWKGRLARAEEEVAKLKTQLRDVSDRQTYRTDDPRDSQIMALKAAAVQDQARINGLETQAKIDKDQIIRQNNRLTDQFTQIEDLKKCIQQRNERICELVGKLVAARAGPGVPTDHSISTIQAEGLSLGVILPDTVPSPEIAVFMNDRREIERVVFNFQR